MAFVLLFIVAYPPEELEDTKAVAIRGLVTSLPLWFLARFLGSLMPAAWGSPLLAFHDWFDLVLPYAALPALGYAVFWRYDERIERPRFLRRLTTFYAACLAPMGFGETARSLLAPDLFIIILLPVIVATLILALPVMIQAWFDTWAWRKALLVAFFVAAGLALSLARWFMLARTWYFAVALVAFALASALRLALPRLMARSPKAL
jgi:hypothetical protein